MLDKHSDICQFPFCRTRPGDSGTMLMGFEFCDKHADGTLIFMGRECGTLREALDRLPEIHTEFTKHGEIRRDDTG